MILTNFSRIGKSLIRRMTGVQENYKIEKYIELTNIKKCEKCQFFEASHSEIQQRYCHQYCEVSKEKIKEVEYYNESNRYHIPVTERLSKLQLKQMLLYHFLGVDSNGMVKNISKKKVAEILNCDVKTVVNNNNRLLELKYILLANSSKDEFVVMLLDYKSYHLTSKEGGGGYIEPSKELIINLFSILNVNTLRLELRKLIEFDNKNIGRDEEKEAKYTYSEIKRLVPKYLNYKGAIDSIVVNEAGPFENILNNEGISFKLKDIYNTKLIKANIIKECETTFDSYIEMLSLEENELIDIFQMSVQYGIDRVKKSLDEIYDNYILKKRYIGSVGALVRRVTTSQVAS